MSEPRVTVTAKTIEAAKPKAARYVIKDSEVRGLELRVSPSGVKTWTLRYRALGQQRRLKLGVYDPQRMTLAAARSAAQAELRKVDGGLDPQAERRAVREAVEAAKRDSIEALCESYIERHAKPKKRTWRADQGHLNREVLKRWKGRPVSSITRRDCRELIDAIAGRGAPIVANRIAALLSRVFRFAVDDEIIMVNPAARLPKPGVEASARPEGERESKPYSDDEIRTIWTATEHLEPKLRALYRLGLLTGQRPTEIGDMAWDEIDGSWWTIPAARTKNRHEHRVYLTQAALDELNRVPRLEDEPHVFAGWRGKRQLAAINALVFADVRPRLRPRHAMRDTVATGLAATGLPIETVARVLNHRYGPKVTTVYNAYHYDKEKRLALTRWERRLLGALTSRLPEKVVALETA